MAKKVVSKPKKITPVAKKASAVKKPAAKKAAPKKTSVKKVAAVKSSAKKVVAKKATKKPVVKKVAAKAAKKAMPKKVLSKPKAMKAVQKRKKVSAIPKGYTSVTPYLMVSNAAQAIEFYKKVFAAKEGFRMEHEGKITHAELKIGSARIMLADEQGDKGNAQSDKAALAVGLHLYTKDCDATIKAAVSAGAKLLRPAETFFYGDRAGMVQDPFGHSWNVATHVEDVSPAVQKKRAAEIYSKK